MDWESGHRCWCWVRFLYTHFFVLSSFRMFSKLQLYFLDFFSFLIKIYPVTGVVHHVLLVQFTQHICFSTYAICIQIEYFFTFFMCQGAKWIFWQPFFSLLWLSRIHLLHETPTCFARWSLLSSPSLFVCLLIFYCNFIW